MEGENRVEKLRLEKCLRKLRKGVGNVDCWGFRVGEQIRQAEKADGATFGRREDERGAMALGTGFRRQLRRRSGGDAVHILELREFSNGRREMDMLTVKLV